MVSCRYRIHRSYELFERRTGMVEVILRIFTISIWDKQGEISVRFQPQLNSLRLFSSKNFIPVPSSGATGQAG